MICTYWEQSITKHQSKTQMILQKKREEKNQETRQKEKKIIFSEGFFWKNKKTAQIPRDIWASRETWSAYEKCNIFFEYTEQTGIFVHFIFNYLVDG